MEGAKRPQGPGGDERDKSKLASSGSKRVKKKTPKKEAKVPRKLGRRACVQDSLFEEAVRILELVNSRYGIGDAYLDQVWGSRISPRAAVGCLEQYLKDEELDGRVHLKATTKIAGCACMITYKYPPRFRPEDNRYFFLFNTSCNNFYLRDKAITALADHEVGTHFYRNYNDGFQVWNVDRKKFQLGPLRTREMLLTEEGLATINTHLRLECRLLWKSALFYYSACMARHLGPSELHAHLGKYLQDDDLRSRTVFRMKRNLADPSTSGNGWDQCYFAGAVKILRLAESIDFSLLHSGKLTLDDLERVRRIAKVSVLKLPLFLRDLPTYVSTLEEMKRENCL